jgi:hypothetical protein
MSSDKTKNLIESVKRFVTSLTDSRAEYSNLPLFVFDIILLPITLIRALLIYLFGSRYAVRGFRFLDVVMHADRPYFNQDGESTPNSIQTIGEDYRVVIRDDSRLYPIDITENAHLLKVESRPNPPNVQRDVVQQSSTRQGDLVQTRSRDVVQNSTNNTANRSDEKSDRGRSIWQTTDEEGEEADDDRPFRDETEVESQTRTDLNVDIDTEGSDASEESEMDVIDEVNRAVQNIDSRIDLDGSDIDELDTNLDVEDGSGDESDDDESENIDTTERYIDKRKFRVDSESDSDEDSESDGVSEGEKMDPIDILLQRAKERRLGKKRSKIFETEQTDETDNTEQTTNDVETDETADGVDDTADRTDSIIDNLESAFEK